MIGERSADDVRWQPPGRFIQIPHGCIGPPILDQRYRLHIDSLHELDILAGELELGDSL
jgi:hypothetical protein